MPGGLCGRVRRSGSKGRDGGFQMQEPKMVMGAGYVWDAVGFRLG